MWGSKGQPDDYWREKRQQNQSIWKLKVFLFALIFFALDNLTLGLDWNKSHPFTSMHYDAMRLAACSVTGSNSDRHAVGCVVTAALWMWTSDGQMRSKGWIQQGRWLPSLCGMWDPPPPPNTHTFQLWMWFSRVLCGSRLTAAFGRQCDWIPTLPYVSPPRLHPPLHHYPCGHGGLPTSLPSSQCGPDTGFKLKSIGPSRPPPKAWEIWTWSSPDGRGRGGRCLGSGGRAASMTSTLSLLGRSEGKAWISANTHTCNVQNKVSCILLYTAAFIFQFFICFLTSKTSIEWVTVTINRLFKEHMLNNSC